MRTKLNLFTFPRRCLYGTLQISRLRDVKFNRMRYKETFAVLLRTTTVEITVDITIFLTIYQINKYNNSVYFVLI